MDDTYEVINALRKRFPKIDGPKKKDICYATQNRQDAVKKLVKEDLSGIYLEISWQHAYFWPSKLFH